MIMQLNAQDAQFLYSEVGNSLNHIMAVLIFDPSTAPGGKVRFKDIIQHVEDRVLTSPVFTRRLHRLPMDLDYPYWVDDEYFDIEHHMRHARLPEPGDWRQFCIHVARYFSQPMDMHRPLWEMYVIEGLDNIPGIPAGSYAVATKIHHCAIDGVSSIRFFSALSDIDAKGTPAVDLSDIDDVTELREPALPEVFMRAAFNNIKSPVKITNTLLQMSPNIVKSVQSAMKVGGFKPGQVPETRFNADVSPHKVFDALVVDLEDLKQIRSACEGATINDVVLTVCGGGLRRYLKFHKELPEQPLVAMAPINARTSSSQADTPGNNISAMTVELQTHIANPLKRLASVRDITQRSKAGKSGLSARLMTDITRHASGATLALSTRFLIHTNANFRLCNLFISNVPGAQQQLYMNGARQIHHLGLAPLVNGMGLFIATPSYNGQLTFNVVSTREILPDIEFFMDCLRESFEELKEAASRPAPASKSRKRRRTKA